ncbi:hypothetical protein KTR66_23020, partial [Roseococcus sp. SDR]|uniref:hypothetical protein n=1 Tax=Roseococcus sp. SDR TaxID=2835532 RepID=UPI001BCBBCA3
DGLAASDNPAASDAVRQLVERVVIHPTKPYKPPRIIVEGRLANMVALAQPGLTPKAAKAIEHTSRQTVKERPGGKAPQ